MLMLLIAAAVIIAASVICAATLLAGVAMSRAALPPELAEEPMDWEPRHPDQSKGRVLGSAPVQRA